MAFQSLYIAPATDFSLGATGDWAWDPTYGPMGGWNTQWITPLETTDNILLVPAWMSVLEFNGVLFKGFGYGLTAIRFKIEGTSNYSEIFYFDGLSVNFYLPAL